MMDPTIVLIDKDRPNSETRYVYVDGRGFLPPEASYPMWLGQSQGFWHGEDLIVWTRDIKQWAITHALPEHSDQLQLIERIRKIGDEIVVGGYLAKNGTKRMSVNNQVGVKFAATGQSVGGGRGALNNATQ